MPEQAGWAEPKLVLGDCQRPCEFGIPGMVQAKTATHLLQEGQRVTVDGTQGWVLAVDE